MAQFSRQDAAALQRTLNRATVACSARCLYQASRWAAELADSLSGYFEEDSHHNHAEEDPTASRRRTSSSTETAAMEDVDESTSYADLVTNLDANEARLEAQELNRYLLAKTYFDCREFERCASVFLPPAQPRMPLSFRTSMSSATDPASDTARMRRREPSLQAAQATQQPSEAKLANLSQKSLFLALYGRYMAGEKRRDEDSEMILGPADKGSNTNREFVGITKILDDYFGPKEDERSGGGFLEFLYGMVLAKSKNEQDARYWLIRSVHLEPCNWSAWLELNSLIGSVEEVRFQPGILSRADFYSYIRRHSDYRSIYPHSYSICMPVWSFSRPGKLRIVRWSILRIYFQPACFSKHSVLCCIIMPKVRCRMLQGVCA